MYVIFSFLEYIEYMYVNHCLVGNITMKRLNPFFSLCIFTHNIYYILHIHTYIHRYMHTFV